MHVRPSKSLSLRWVFLWVSRADLDPRLDLFWLSSESEGSDSSEVFPSEGSGVLSRGLRLFFLATFLGREAPGCSCGGLLPSPLLDESGLLGLLPGSRPDASCWRRGGVACQVFCSLPLLPLEVVFSSDPCLCDSEAPGFAALYRPPRGTERCLSIACCSSPDDWGGTYRG